MSEGAHRTGPAATLRLRVSDERRPGVTFRGRAGACLLGRWTAALGRLEPAGTTISLRRFFSLVGRIPGLYRGGNVKKLSIALAAFVFASVAMAQLSKYKDWAKSPEADFLTPSERGEFGALKTDEEAEKFIAN